MTTLWEDGSIPAGFTRTARGGRETSAGSSSRARRWRARSRRDRGCSCSSTCSSESRRCAPGSSDDHTLLSHMRGIKMFGESACRTMRLLAETPIARAQAPPRGPQPAELWMSRARSSGPSRSRVVGRRRIRCCTGRQGRGTCWSRCAADHQRQHDHDADAALGMAEAFRTRTAVTGVRDSPLYHLTRAARRRCLADRCRRATSITSRRARGTWRLIDVRVRDRSIERGLTGSRSCCRSGSRRHDRADLRDPRRDRGGRAWLVGCAAFTQLMSDNLRLLGAQGDRARRPYGRALRDLVAARV